MDGQATRSLEEMAREVEGKPAVEGLSPGPCVALVGMVIEVPGQGGR